jgi:hypothetical protein
MTAAGKYLTGAAGAVRRAEITARLIAGEPIKAIAAAVGVCPQHVARLAREEEVQRVWLTAAEVALIAQLRAPVLTCPECQNRRPAGTPALPGLRAPALRCPECQAESLRAELPAMVYEQFGTFFECARCKIGSLTTAWKPAKT